MRRLLDLAFVIVTTASCAGPLVHRVPDVIAVTGRGQIMVKPDTALARLGAEARRPALADATADVAQRMAAVLDRVKAAGVRAEDIATVQYAVAPLSAPGPKADDTPQVVGYQVSNVVDVKVRDVVAVGRVVDAAVEAGANVIQGIRFSLEDRKPAEARARQQAVADARNTASELAHAAGVTLGPLVWLSEGVAAEPVFETRRGMGVALSARAPGPIEAGEQQIVVTVEARYRIDSPASP
jgi:uncharacterized protein